MSFILSFLCSFLLFTQENGKLFDPGVLMKQPADNAPKALKQYMPYMGDYHVMMKRKKGSEWITSQGFTVITLFNRGSGFMERTAFDVKSNEGLRHERITLVTYQPTQKLWMYGQTDNLDETIVLFDGQIKNDTLIVYQGIRKGGGNRLSILRYKQFRNGEQSFMGILEESVNYMQSFDIIETRTYTKRTKRHPWLNLAVDTGKPWSKRQPQSAEFDFLIGDKTAKHSMVFNGQPIQFPAFTTAVYVLGGNAIMEFNWFDVDTSNPNAATTIIRIYNRSMRRWESLFTNNRSHGQLFFGGVKEDDKMVLTLFDTNTESGNISQFVFHSMNENGYDWYSNVSRDRGITFSKTWEIEIRNK